MPIYYSQQKEETNYLDNLVKMAGITSVLSKMDSESKKQTSLDQFNRFMQSRQGAGMSGVGFTGATVNPSTGNVSYTFGQTPEDKRQQKNRQKFDDYSDLAVNALQALHKVGTKSAKLGDFERGFDKQMGSKLKFFLAEQGKDKDVTEFVGAVQQELIPLARNLAEEKGPITDSDIKKIEKGLTGGATTPLEDKLTLIEDFKKKVRLAIQNKMSKAGLSPESLRQNYPVLFDQLTTNFELREDDKGNRALVVAGYDSHPRNIIEVSMFGKKGKKK